mgnify:CR=1 FL=1
MFDGSHYGNLMDYGVKYDQVDFKDDQIDFESIEKKLNEHGSKVKVVFIQRSKGYQMRPSFSVKQMTMSLLRAEF